MKYLNKIATAFCSAALGLMALTSCEGGDLYSIDSPDWISAKADSIAEANKGKGDEVIEGLQEDVYTVGATDFSTGWWAQFSKYYQIREGETWITQFNLNINPSASNTYKNYAMIICNDEDRGAANYKEYGAIRFDYQPTGNSEWGEYIDRSLATSTLEFATDTDGGIEQLGGKVTVTVDRSQGGLLVTMTNGKVTKTYTQTSPLANLNADASNTTIRCFLVPEGSYIEFIGSTLEPIGGFTSREDKLPLSMELNGVPKKVLLGADLTETMANVTATVQFEQAVSKTVAASDLTFQVIPDVTTLGKKTLVAVYTKTYKGEAAPTPVIAYADIEVVDKLYTTIGNSDNSTGFWGAHSDNIKVGPKETFVTTFTNYSNGVANWNNFVVVLCNSTGGTEYAVVRADNFGWGQGYEACTPVCENGGDWAAWLKAMDGAKVHLAVTNNGDGTADVQAVIEGNNGAVYTQEYKGINTVDPDDFYFNLTVDGSHIEFDDVIGADDNSTGFWGAHSNDVTIPVGKTFTTRFRNYTSGAANWNNFVVVLTRDNDTEYAVVRADNFGWGDSYAACTPVCDNGGDWAAWLKAMDGALVTVSVTNNGTSADVKCVIIGNDGKTYKQDYIGISPVDGNDLDFHFTIDGSHLVFE